ncbi:thiamine phosphate synthase [Exiguobacterium aestuarii]|uniref:Thiamine-phosphate synthase n=1 Tax=Exiguobacterium aestuarii TaxID=273527 RepID=A0ABW2PGR3_9BACL|nr:MULTISPECIES: thiamine phosphate synthase [Exiguobacterium]MCT4786325.1 thiamine phosphate synthase [Exiguobacterium aestuarii]
MTFCTKQALAKQLRLYFVCGTIDAFDLVSTVETALRCGVTCFQFREKGKDALYGDEKEAMARTLQQVCRQAEVPFIINDDVELALTIDADGVHVGQDDLPAEWVREQLGPDKWLGVSVHTMEEVRAALPFADYVGIGPIHETKSKLDAGHVRGTELIRQVRLQYPQLPIVGIGGIRPEHVPSIIHDGADGVAVISAIASAPDVATATRRFACL